MLHYGAKTLQRELRLRRRQLSRGSWRAALAPARETPLKWVQNARNSRGAARVARMRLVGGGVGGGCEWTSPKTGRWYRHVTETSRLLAWWHDALVILNCNKINSRYSLQNLHSFVIFMPSLCHWVKFTFVIYWCLLSKTQSQNCLG